MCGAGRETHGIGKVVAFRRPVLNGRKAAGKEQVLLCAMIHLEDIVLLKNSSFSVRLFPCLDTIGNQ